MQAPAEAAEVLVPAQFPQQAARHQAAARGPGQPQAARRAGQRGGRRPALVAAVQHRLQQQRGQVTRWRVQVIDINTIL